MPKRVVALALACAALGGLASYLARRADRLEAAHPLKDLSLYRIEVDRQGEPDLILEEKAGLWRLRAPVDDLAAVEAVDELTSSLFGLSIGARVSGDPASWPSYGLSESGAVHVKAFSRSQAVAGLDGWFGAPALGGGTLYFRQAREKGVYLAEGLPRGLLARKADAYRERALFPDSLGPLQRIVIKDSARSLALVKGSGLWETAAHLRIADFAGGSIGRPILTVEAAGASRAVRWEIGGAKPDKKGKPVFRWARSDDRPGVIALVAIYDVDTLLKALKK